MLSYPAVAPGEPFQPPDIGQWILPDTYNATNKPANAVLCENSTRYCLSNPLTAAGQQFSFGSTIYQQTLQVDQSLSTTGKSAWSNKLSDSLDVEAIRQVHGVRRQIQRLRQRAGAWRLQLGRVVDLDQRQ